MSYNVILLPAAEDDYQEILRYFERQFDSQQAIRSFVKDFGEVLLRLEETPTIYGYSHDEALRQREYRKFLIGRYVASSKLMSQEMPWKFTESSTEHKIIRNIYNEERRCADCIAALFFYGGVCYRNQNTKRSPRLP